MILDAYRTSFEPVWYVVWRTLIEEPLVVPQPPVLPWTTEGPEDPSAARTRLPRPAAACDSSEIRG